MGISRFRPPKGVMTSEGVPSTYGFGLDVDPTDPTAQTFSHPGNFPGVSAELVCKQGKCVIVLLSNQDIIPAKIEEKARSIIFNRE